MKKNLFLVFLGLSSLYLIACKDGSIEAPLYPPDDFFPKQNESSYIFSIQVIDSTGITLSGIRRTEYNGDAIIDDVTYQVAYDSIQFDRTNILSKSFFRKSSTGVFYFVDTSGLDFNIPDSLKQNLKIDREQRLLYNLLSVNQGWSVFKLNIKYSGITFSLIDLFAKVISADTLRLDLNSVVQNKESLKIKYDLIIQIDPTSPPLRYEAFGWTVKDIGFVKWDGNAEVFNFLLNENIFPPGTNVNMDLITYHL